MIVETGTGGLWCPPITNLMVATAELFALLGQHGSLANHPCLAAVSSRVTSKIQLIQGFHTVALFLIQDTYYITIKSARPHGPQLFNNLLYKYNRQIDAAYRPYGLGYFWPILPHTHNEATAVPVT